MPKVTNDFKLKLPHQTTQQKKSKKYFEETSDQNSLSYVLEFIMQKARKLKFISRASLQNLKELKYT